MHTRNIRLSALAIAPLFLVTTACATKGFVRKEITNQRTHVDSALANERVARASGDSAVSAQVAVQLAELRRGLDSLRTEFGAKITAMEEGLRFAMPVNFGFDDANVRETDKAVLTRFAQIANRYYNGSAVTVEGFADPAGTAEYNLRLSRERAENVRQFLLTQGFDSAQLKSIGYGETRQVVKGAEREEPGAEKNRRVVFVIETKGAAMVATASADIRRQ